MDFTFEFEELEGGSGRGGYWLKETSFFGRTISGERTKVHYQFNTPCLDVPPRGFVGSGEIETGTMVFDVPLDLAELVFGGAGYSAPALVWPVPPR